ncbi:MAG: sulfotransferase family 2 domain-containing protein [Atribacterota bacterium]
MINHDLKCVFVHIMHTGGTSIEFNLCGNDWWKIEKKTKHLMASQAKNVYREYWKDYFVFSFVRNPWDRIISMFRHRNFFGIFMEKKQINFQRYFDQFSKHNVLLEHDYRAYNIQDILTPKHKSNQVYLNILDENIDFIGRFENLQEDFDKICDILKISQRKLPHKNKSKRKSDYRSYYNDETKQIVCEMYKNDIDFFGYRF